MDYKKKYLKYKQKYINLKKLYGGVVYQNPMQPNIINFKHLNKIQLIDETNIGLISINDHMLVPMNAYQIVDATNPTILSTIGLVDCVLVTIFNKKYGRYFAHYLKFNEFFEDLSNACESIHDNNECKLNYNANYPDPGPICDKDSTKIKPTIPKWIKEFDTVINIASQSDAFKILSRYNQLKKLISPLGIKVNIYFNELQQDVIDSIFKNLPDNEDNNSMKQKLRESDIWLDAFFMDSLGTLYACKDKDNDLKSNLPLKNFYNNITVNRFASFHNNKKCVKKYGLKKSFYETKLADFKATEQLARGNGYTTSPYYQGVNQILQLQPI